MITYTSEHARSGSAYLQMILADLATIEHSVETGNLINLHGGHVQNFGNLVHG